MSETSGYGHGHVTGHGSTTNQCTCLAGGMQQLCDNGYGGAFGHSNDNGGGYDDGEGYGCGVLTGRGAMVYPAQGEATGYG
jgi:hypothetical protein